MANKEFFLNRLLESVRSQTFQDYELVITEDGKMAENTNSAIKKATGEFVKILYMDDFFTHKDALREIVRAFEDEQNEGEWLVTGCSHEPGKFVHYPSWDDEILTGKNTIGSPSVLTMKRSSALLFDENLSWLLDCELYHRLHEKYGKPIILKDINVTLGLGEHQMTNLMSDDYKLSEHEYVKNKYK